LAHICQQIQRIVIINNNLNANHGTTKLIEFQKNLKYFGWVDDFIDDYFHFDWEQLEDPYTEILNILKKHANTLIHFEISLHFDYLYSTNYDYTFLQYALLELHNLKILEINSPRFLDNADFNEKLEMVTYRDLEIIEIDVIDICQVTCIIKSSLYLKELWINNFHIEKDFFNDDSLNFVNTICDNCFLIEYLSVPVFPLLENHFIEFERLLKKCQNLRSLNFKDA
ncbi:5518_t:CDS:1, partial [Rhizophagus irregularis]